MHKNVFVCVLAAIFFSTCLIRGASAAGISTTCGEMYLGNLKVGQSYSLKSLLGYQFNATYQGEWLVNLNIYVEKPFKPTLDGYEPIPDPAWATIERPSFALDPYQTAETDIRIDIPNDPKYLGKKYAVIIKPVTSAAAEAGGGVAIGTALACTLRLEIAAKPPSPEEVRQLKRQMMGQIMQTSITPERIFIAEAPIGRKIDLKKEYGESLRIVNSSDFDCDVTLEQMTPDKVGVFLPRDYRIPEKQEWLHLGTKKVKVASNQIFEIPLTLELPKTVKKGEKLYFTTRVIVKSKIREANYIVKVYVETETPPEKNK